MKISVLCSSVDHPIYPRLEKWATAHAAELCHSTAELSGGDLLFLISCSEIVGPAIRNRYRHTLVIHAADLPRGRGWSPQVWQIIEGRNELCVTMLEAADKIDAGPIWAQRWVEFSGHELCDEIHDKLFDAEIELMNFAVANADTVKPRAQDAEGATYYRKRTPEDSRLDPNKSIAEQFDLLRIADEDRYPAFVELRGHRYAVTVRKLG